MGDLQPAGADARVSLPGPFEYAPVPIEIGLWWTGIEAIDTLDLGARGYPPVPCPVDALAIGHVLGATSLGGPERALDVAMSRAARAAPADADIPAGERVLTAFARRGVLSGHLGSMSYLPDPRAPGRVVAVAGAGLPGRLGQAELAVLAAELCWSVGHLGKRHLATPLIGAGSLRPETALKSWIRGLRAALVRVAHDANRRLLRLTFVASAPAVVLALDDAIRRRVVAEGRRPPHKPRLDITYTAVPAALRAELEAAPSSHDGPPPSRVQEEPAPTRIAVEWSGKRFRIGVMTATAVQPQRDFVVDPGLVDDANRRLATPVDALDLMLLGRFVGDLLVREELRLVAVDAPLVLMVDPTSARIHWELVADPGTSLDSMTLTTPLGISPGVCRQLRTTSAPPRPELPPPPRRLLRVLVVADPADNLPKARDEGRAIAELFGAFNDTWGHEHYQVEVTSLIGAAEATRTDVLFRLMTHGPYDILHYAGHCTCDEADPESSGWIFEHGSVLSIHELDRVDVIPRFVFSNACRSGAITGAGPAAAPSLALAPTFAAAFFGRGVANLVCTAWSIDDALACSFALELYAALLGLTVTTTPDGARHYEADRTNGPRPMYQATRHARRVLAQDFDDLRTWGAYQHYGDPYLRLFDVETLLRGARVDPDDPDPADDVNAGRVGGILP